LEALLAPLGASSAFTVPLQAGEQIVGLLQSVCLRPRGFTTEQVQLLYRVADLLGPAVSNCRLIGQLLRTNEELRQTQHRLVHAEKMRALGEMAGGMAHEFNNSLCGVLGFLDLTLSARDLDCDMRKHLETARTCAHDAAQVVRRVQDFARQRRAEQATQPIDLDELTRQAVDMARHRWEGTGVVAEVNAGSGATVLGAPCELREVVTNLIFNAVDAMPRGGALRVRTWRSGDRACLAVSDTGVGIPETLREKIFEPFFTTKGEKGNGLGLSVTFAIVRRHNGEITADSRPGLGTTFEVRLPLAPALPRASQGEVVVQAPSRRQLRILVVEDERGVREFLSSALTGLGHRVRLACDGTEGVAAVGEDSFDVVLTDLGLPGVRGDEVARAVAERRPGTPVLLLTGWGLQMREDQEQLPGVCRVLAKPITLSALAAAVDEAARGAHAV
jgi:signal transduction histidine kinase/ActR/RegA family two-component response regulator